MPLLPPEWAPQSAMLLAWPRAGGDWREGLDAARAAVATIATALLRRQPVILLAADGESCASIETHPLLRAARRLQLVVCPLDDIWVRDFGPLTVFDRGRVRHLDFRFDGWGGKYPAGRDNTVTAALAAAGLLTGERQAKDLVLEGGSIEVDGCGALLTTRRCLLAHNRNPGMQAPDYEGIFGANFGVDTVHWLAHGQLLGDDTDGHVDTLARFAEANTIVYQGATSSSDEQHALLAALAEELRALRDARGQPYRLLELPLPRPLHDPVDGRRLPAGYANFLIANGCILTPAYNDPADTVAAAVLQQAFPDRDIVCVDCRALIRQNGSLHCAAMQLPAESEHA